MVASDAARAEWAGQVGGGPTISVLVAAAIVVADMVGVGVFTSLGFQVKDIPSGFSILALWTLSAAGAVAKPNAHWVRVQSLSPGQWSITGGCGAVWGGDAVYMGNDDAALDGEERSFLGDDLRRVFGVRDRIVYGGGDLESAAGDSAGLSP